MTWDGVQNSEEGSVQFINENYKLTSVRTQ